MEHSGDIPKEAVLYVFRPETNYTCGKCVFIKDGDICAVFAEKVSPERGSCGVYIHGDIGDRAEIPILGLLTKEQAGYDENLQGFSCKRCEYFILRGMDCKKVDKDSEGDTPGVIHPNACCNRWEADDERSGKTDEELGKEIASMEKTSKVKLKVSGPASALPGLLRGMMRGKAEPETKPANKKAKFSSGKP